jgi:hypothetical protein
MEQFVTASATKPNTHGETLTSERILISNPSAQEYIRDLTASCPTTGSGLVHNWLYRTARKLHLLGFGKNAIIQLLEQGSASCGRAMKPHEIEDAVEASERDLRCPQIGAEHRPPKWPEADQKQIESIARDGARLADLKRMSPVKWEDDRKQRTDEIIDILFPGNPLLCMGLSKFVFNTRPREAWRGELALTEFIVPSPMSKIVGITKDGKPSERTLDSTGPRRFLVVEFDKGTLDQHAAILVHLGKSAPLAMVVYSGKKSLHGWFYAHEQPEVKVEKLFREAVILGADPQLWSRSQFVRLPDGWRAGNQRRQWTIYLNPKIVGGH